MTHSEELYFGEAALPGVGGGGGGKHSGVTAASETPPEIKAFRAADGNTTPSGRGLRERGRCVISQRRRQIEWRRDGKGQGLDASKAHSFRRLVMSARSRHQANAQAISILADDDDNASTYTHTSAQPNPTIHHTPAI